LISSHSLTHTQTERRRNKANQILFLKSHYKITAFIVYSMQKTRYMWQLVYPFFHRKDTVKEYLKQAWREMKHQGGGGEGVDEGNEAWSEITRS